MADGHQLAKFIDHTLLRADATPADIQVLCREAAAYGFATVCVGSRFVPLAAQYLAGCDVGVCTVVGFPLGAMLSSVKAYETRVAIAEGATEIDMVIAIGELKAGDTEAVRSDIATVVEAAGQTPVKVILETCLLTDAEVVTACRLSMDAGAAFVKTSTGFSSGGATVEDVQLMRRTVGNTLGVKASGGIRDLNAAPGMLRAGANRLGCSSGVAIVQGNAGTSHY